MNAADSWADAGTPRSSAREGLKSSYGVGIVNLIISINITCRYRNSKFLPSDDSCQHRTWERVQAARENESSGNAWENRTRWRGRWRQEPVSPRISGTLEAIDVTPSRIVFLLMLSMLVGMKDSSVKLLINDLAACQDKKKFWLFLPLPARHILWFQPWWNLNPLPALLPCEIRRHALNG